MATAVLLYAVAGCGNGDAAGPDDDNNGNNGGSGLSTEQVVTGLSAPLFLTHAGDSRLFIVEQRGRIRIVENGQLLDTPFLDISNIVLDEGERGLLSMAFHPNYSNNGFLYVYHTDQGGDSRVALYSGSGKHRGPKQRSDDHDDWPTV